MLTTEQSFGNIPRMLKPGLSRRQVKDYLQAHATVFGERCCYEERDAFAVIVKVGEEDVPWYCSEWPDYVAFEFAPTEPHKWSPLAIFSNCALSMLLLPSRLAETARMRGQNA